MYVCACVWGKVLCGVCHHCSILAQLVELILDLISLNESMSIFHPSPPTLQSLSLPFSVSAPPSLSLFLPLSKFLSLLLSLFISVYIMFIIRSLALYYRGAKELSQLGKA